MAKRLFFESKTDGPNLASLRNKEKRQAQHNTNRAGAIDQRTTQHPGYAISQRERKRVEELFGWMKIIGMLKKVKLRGLDKVGWLFTFVAAAYNLRRLQKLQARATE